jgi:hypothetical protein
VTVPFLAGCFSVLQAPLPAPGETRENVRGVVRNDSAVGTRIEFSSVDDVRSTESEIILIGTLRQPDDGAPPEQTVTRSYPRSALSGILVREVDTAKTSGIIGGLIVGAIALATFVLTGQAEDGRPLPGIR